MDKLNCHHLCDVMPVTEKLNFLVGMIRVYPITWLIKNFEFGTKLCSLTLC